MNDSKQRAVDEWRAQVDAEIQAAIDRGELDAKRRDVEWVVKS